MAKKFLAITTIIIIAVVCFVTLLGCDSSARNVKYWDCEDFLFETSVNITMSKRLSKVGMWSGMKPTKYSKGLSDLFELMQMQDGYTKTLYDNYILIETTKNGRLYTWGVFSTLTFGKDYNGEYNYILTNMGVNDGEFFFPIYTMEQPLLKWQVGQRYKCNSTMVELAEFYILHGYTVETADNILTISSPTVVKGNIEYNGSWDITFYCEGSVSVDNILEHEAIYC